MFDFKPNWVKYLGFLMHFSQVEITIPVGTKENHRKQGTALLRGGGTRAAPVFFSHILLYSWRRSGRVFSLLIRKRTLNL